jgi:hypothetical protein
MGVHGAAAGPPATPRVDTIEPNRAAALEAMPMLSFLWSWKFGAAALAGSSGSQTPALRAIAAVAGNSVAVTPLPAGGSLAALQQ